MSQERLSQILFEQEVTRKAAKLFDQQMWCWGKDIMSEQGNLLVQYGCDIQKHVDRERRGTRYVLPLGIDTKIILMALGIVYLDENKGAAQFERSRYQPLFNPDTECINDVFEFKALEGFGRAKTQIEKDFLRDSQIDCAKFIKNYETWILQNAHETHKNFRLNSWVNPIATPETLVNCWEEVHEDFLEIRSTAANRV